jgi:glycosyltransferase involved in cell wall biosynthesis
MIHQERAGQPSFAVVIPMFDEEAGAETCVRRVCAELAHIPNMTRLITVEDGSRDHTGQILERLAAGEPRLMLVRHGQNRGYGAALRTGTEKAYEAGFQYVLFMDSDLTNDPGDLHRFAGEMTRGVDVIKATRYSKGGTVSGVPTYRVWISRIGNALARVLFHLPVHDCTNGFRAVKADLLMSMDLKENRFPIIMEELYWSKYLARTFSEVPVTLKNRADDVRPTSFSYRPGVFWKYLKYPIRAFAGIQPHKLLKEKQ